MDQHSFVSVPPSDLDAALQLQQEPPEKPYDVILPATSLKSNSFVRRTQTSSSTPTASASCCGLCLVPKKNYHLRVAGPSMGGKTTLIQYLLHGRERQAMVAPTDAMQVSEVYWNSTSFIVWDFRKFGDEDLKIATRTTSKLPLNPDQPLIAQKQTFDALVYLVDVSDPGRLKIAAKDFKRLLETYHDVPLVLVLGNKCDRITTKRSHATDEVKSQLKVVETAYDRECEVFLISSITGEGVNDAFDWLNVRIRQQEGLLTSLSRFFNFEGMRGVGTISCGQFCRWDPLSMCRFSRLS